MIAGREPFGEVAEGRGEQRAGVRDARLVAPQAAEARRRAQLQRPRALRPRELQGFPKILLGLLLRIRRTALQEQRPSQAVELGLVEEPPTAADQRQRLIQRAEPLVNLAVTAVGVREQG